MRARAVLPWLAVLALAVPALGQDAEPKRVRPGAGERYLAVVGGDVHTGDGRLIRRGTVLCRGSKIVAVGADVEVPEGARVIDAKGRWVLPGFVAPRGNSFGVQRGRPRRGERYRDCLDPESIYVELALSAGITAFHAEGRGRGTYSSTNAVLRTARGRPGAMVLKEPAALTVSWSNASAANRATFEDLLRKGRAWIDAGKRGRAPATSSVIAALERKIPVRISAYDRSDTSGALRLARRHDLQLVLLNCHEAWTLTKEIAAAGAIAVVQPRGRRWPPVADVETRGSRIETAALLEKAGARFCVLPPGGFGARPYGISLGGVSGRDLLTYALEGGFAIRGGASTDAALRALTLTAAEALGVADRIGSLTPGKDADIVVYQGDPFDFRMLAETTVVAGRVAYERTKSKLFAHLKDRGKPGAK